MPAILMQTVFNKTVFNQLCQNRYKLAVDSVFVNHIMHCRVNLLTWEREAPETGIDVGVEACEFGRGRDPTLAFLQRYPFCSNDSCLSNYMDFNIMCK